MGLNKGTGEGSIYFNKQRKKWNAQYMDFDVEKGDYKVKTKSFKTEEEAKKFLATIMYQKENELYVEHNGIPICEIMRSNLRKKLETNQISSTQFARVTHTIDKISKTYIGSKNIDKITAKDLQEYMNSQKHLSNSSLSKIFGQFNQVFKIAMNKGYIMKNPMVEVLKPRSDKKNKKVRAMTLDEQQPFTEYLLNTEAKKCKYKNVYLIQMYLGLRCSEALSLEIADFDLKKGIAHIHTTLSIDENNNIIRKDTTKTPSGDRYVQIPKFIYPHIIEQMRIGACQENNEEHLLFKPEDKQYTSRTNVNSELKRILKRKYNIDDISTHSLRHTFCTRCLEADIEPMVIAKIMGHSDVGLIFKVYAEIQEKFKNREMEKINEYYMSENIGQLAENNKIENQVFNLDNISDEKEL